MRCIRWLSGFVVGVVLAWTGWALAQPSYQVIGLGDNLYPYALNDAAIIAGARWDFNTLALRAVLAAGHQVKRLPDLGSESIALSLNNRGQAAGYAFDTAGVSHAVWWDATGQLHLLPGPLPSAAYGISGSGVVVGEVGAPPWRNDAGQAVFWENGAVQGLENDGHVSWALAISGTTIVGGERLLIGGVLQGLVWLPDGTVEVFPGEATAISQGLVAGYVFGDSAWRWDATQGWMMLETLAGMQACSAWGINGQGLTVGYCLPTTAGGGIGMLWLPDGHGVTLASRLLNDQGPPPDNFPGGVIERGVAINSRGTIVGMGYVGGVWQGVLLVPVPALAGR